MTLHVGDKAILRNAVGVHTFQIIAAWTSEWQGESKRRYKAMQVQSDGKRCGTYFFNAGELKSLEEAH
jgi:hypothetical protein